MINDLKVNDKNMYDLIKKSKGYKAYLKAADKFTEDYNKVCRVLSPEVSIENDDKSYTYDEDIERKMKDGYDVLSYEGTINKKNKDKKFDQEEYVISRIIRYGKVGNETWKKEYVLIDMDDTLYKLRNAKEFNEDDMRNLEYPPKSIR